MDYLIRRELDSEYRTVEELTRKAFWNLHVPGCDEHYLVHVMRNHKDFIPELDLVLEIQGKIIGNIMYTKSKLMSESENEMPALTFGPVSILPEYQRKGYGKKLIEHSFIKAKDMGYKIIVIFGNPANYVSLGFKACKRYNICYGNNVFPSGMLVKELEVNSIDYESMWIYEGSEVYNIDKEKAEKFDFEFEEMKKEILPGQEEFYILSNSRIVTDII